MALALTTDLLRQRLRLGEPVAASVRLRSAPVKAKPIAAKLPF